MTIAIRLIRAALVLVLGVSLWTAAHARADGIEYLMVPSAAMGRDIPASADPVNDPCGLAVSFLCRFIPIAPELDGDVDLTKQLPPADPAALPPDSLPPADICAKGCA